jgi:hypothetical protein
MLFNKENHEKDFMKKIGKKKLFHDFAKKLQPIRKMCYLIYY